MKDTSSTRTEERKTPRTERSGRGEAKLCPYTQSSLTPAFSIFKFVIQVAFMLRPVRSAVSLNSAGWVLLGALRMGMSGSASFGGEKSFS